MWADSSKLALYAIHAYVPSLSPGDHAGWTAVAWLWLALVGADDPARVLPLLSAVAAAVAVALLFLLVRRRGGDLPAAHTAAAILAVSHSHYWGATVTETYALAVALAVCCAWAATFPSRGAAFAAGSCAGLAASCHLLSLLVTAPFLLTQRRRWVPLALGAALGAAPVWLALFGAPSDPLTGHHTSHLGTFSWHALAFVDTSRWLGGLARIALVLAFGLGPLGLAAVLGGIRSGRAASAHPHPRLAAAALVALLALLATYLSARLHLQMDFLLLGVLLLVPPSLPRWGIASHLLLQVAAYTLLPLALPAAHHHLGVRVLPHRDNAWYFLCPVKTFETGPETYATRLLAAAPPNALVVADFNPGALLVFVQRTRGLRPDVQVLPTLVDELQPRHDAAQALASRLATLARTGRPLVLADRFEPYYHVDEMQCRFGLTVEPCGPGWTVRLGGPLEGEWRADRDSNPEPSDP